MLSVFYYSRCYGCLIYLLDLRSLCSRCPWPVCTHIHIQFEIVVLSHNLNIGGVVNILVFRALDLGVILIYII